MLVHLKGRSCSSVFKEPLAISGKTLGYQWTLVEKDCIIVYIYTISNYRAIFIEKWILNLLALCLPNIHPLGCLPSFTIGIKHICRWHICCLYSLLFVHLGIFHCSVSAIVSYKGPVMLLLVHSHAALLYEFASKWVFYTHISHYLPAAPVIGVLISSSSLNLSLLIYSICLTAS